MRKIGAYAAIGVLAAVILSPPPAAAFGFHLGLFHFGFPFFGHHHRHRLYMHANPNDLARPAPAPSGPAAPGDASGATSTGATSTGAISAGATPTGATPAGATPALLYPSLALPAVFQNIFWPAYASPWPFSYQAIFATAFATGPGAADAQLCRQPFDANTIVGRTRSELAPTNAQLPLLQRVGGALGAASGYLAKSCPSEVPAEPVARLQLMESQLEELAMALNMVRPPLQDFEQSLSPVQHRRWAAVAAPQSVAYRQSAPNNVAASCGGAATAINWSIDQIYQSVQPTDDQRDALSEVKQAFGKAAADLEAHCPTSAPPTALGRLDSIQARLDSTWRAVLSIQVALADFEARLSDEQKSRFAAMNFAAR